MGTWGTDIKENDISGEVYDNYFELYNRGQNPDEISERLIIENESIINNPYDSNNFWLALALAQWETKALDPIVFEKVKTIIVKDEDIQIWKQLNSDEKDIENRKKDLKKLLNQIQTEKLNPKSRIKQKPEKVKPVFSIGDCLAFKHENGNYGGIIILAEIDDSESGLNLVAGTRINQGNKPTIYDFENAEVLIRSYKDCKDSPILVWTWPFDFKKVYSTMFELIGKINIEKEYKPEIHKYGITSDWGFTKLIAQLQFEHEKRNSKPTKIIKVTDLTKNKKWWKIW